MHLLAPSLLGFGLFSVSRFFLTGPARTERDLKKMDKNLRAIEDYCTQISQQQFQPNTPVPEPIRCATLNSVRIANRYAPR
jgi:hypothetical protein